MWLSAVLGGIGYYLLMQELNRDKDREIIEDCLKDDATLIRWKPKEDYIYYQYKMSGKEINIDKLRKILREYLGKDVRVYFDRVLTVRVYRKKIPNFIEREDDFRVGNGKINIGMDEGGCVYHDFKEYPHMIIAGSTGYGKTYLIKNILQQIDPKDEIILIDLKNSRDDYPTASARTIEEAKRVLEYVESQMLNVKGRGRIFVFIDEASELNAPRHLTRAESGDYLKCQEIASKIARMGRSLNIHLIFATQYPTGDVLPREIKQNAECRIVFRLPTVVASQVALDEKGAENLPTGVPGRGLYKTDRLTTIQAFKFEEEKEEGEILNVKKRVKEKKRVRRDVEIGERGHNDS